MSGRQGGVAVPLITLVVSFGLMLALGGWLGEPKSTEDKATPQGSPASVHLVLREPSGPKGAPEPYPVLVLTVSLAPRTKNKKPDGVATGTVTVCLTLGDGWSPARGDPSRWTQQPGKNQFCRPASSTDGQIELVDLWLERP